MKIILEKIPGFVKNTVVLCYGIILLIYAFNLFHTALNKVIIISAALMILYGFLELGGPAKAAALFKNKDKKPNYDEHNNDNDELF